MTRYALALVVVVGAAMAGRSHASHVARARCGGLGRKRFDVKATCLTLAFAVTVCLSFGACSSDQVESTKKLCQDIKKCRAACDGGKAVACRELGVWFLVGGSDDHGGVVVQDRGKAAELFEKACTGDDLFACARLANAYAEGDGVGRDLQRAADIAEDACKRNEGRACDVIVDVARKSGADSRAAEERAARAYERACANGDGDGEACWTLIYRRRYAPDVALKLGERLCARPKDRNGFCNSAEELKRVAAQGSGGQRSR